MPLSDLKCRNEKSGPKLKKLSDGGGLQLWVKPTGGRLWRLAYRFDGKQKLLALGSYPTVSLADARLARDEAKRLLEAGYDPATHKKEEAEAQTNTFRAIAEEYISRLAQQGRSDATVEKTKWLLTFACPVFGDLSIKKIDAATVTVPLPRQEGKIGLKDSRLLRLEFALIAAGVTIYPLPHDGKLRTGRCLPSASSHRPRAAAGSAAFGL
jgi:hypothetical protein